MVVFFVVRYRARCSTKKLHRLSNKLSAASLDNRTNLVQKFINTNFKQQPIDLNQYVINCEQYGTLSANK